TNGTWQIVGVMPQGFTYPIGTSQRDLWVPYVMTPQERTRPARNLFNSYVRTVARLKPGVTAGEARAGMSRLMADMTAENPAWFRYIDATVPTLKEAVVGGALRSWMLMLLGAVTCVLLVGAVNVANLLLARATVRSREIGIRAALGATRWRLMRS